MNTKNTNTKPESVALMTGSDTREIALSYVSKLPDAMRVEFDKYCTAVAQEKVSSLPADRQRAKLIMMLTADKDALKASGFKTVGDFVSVVLDCSGSLASQYVFAGKNYWFNDKPETVPECGKWYTATSLYLLKDVALSRIAEDCKNGTLKPAMTNAMLKEYAAKAKLENPAKPESDSKAKLTKTYTAHILALLADGTVKTDTLYALTMDEVKTALIPEDSAKDDDRFGSFNPHAKFTNADGKEIACKGMFFASGAYMARATYYEDGKKADIPAIPAAVLAVLDTLPEKERAAVLAAYGKTE